MAIKTVRQRTEEILDVKIHGKKVEDFIAGCLEDLDKKTLQVEKSKLQIGFLKQCNNYLKQSKDIYALELKEYELAKTLSLKTLSPTP